MVIVAFEVDAFDSAPQPSCWSSYWDILRRDKNKSVCVLVEMNKGHMQTDADLKVVPEKGSTWIMLQPRIPLGKGGPCAFSDEMWLNLQSPLNIIQLSISLKLKGQHCASRQI